MTNDNEEPSAASAGSVAGEPVAWAVMPRNSDYCVTLSTRREAAQKAAERKVEVGEYATMDDIAVVPLYRQPQDGVVRLPPLDPNGAPGWNAAIGAVREALAEAGVDWDTE